MRTGLVRWLFCGLSGAAICLVAVLFFASPPYGPQLWLFPAFGLLWALINAAMARGLPASSRSWFLATAAVLGAFGGHYFPRWLLWTVGFHHPMPLVSDYLTGGTMGAVAAFVGALVAAYLWWPEDVLGRRRFVGLSVLLALGYLLLMPPWGPWFGAAREKARASACLSNLYQLGLATLMYAKDNDDRLPLSATFNDLAGIDYDRIARFQGEPGHSSKEVIGSGAIFPYCKNAGIFHCPSDPWNRDCWGSPILDRFPKPGLSYTWNASIAGKVPASLPCTWLLHDREPWHHNGWNVGFADGHVEWCAEVPGPHPVPPRP